MIITCPSCQKKFEIDENLIPEKGRLLRCGSCDHTWFFENKVQQYSIFDESEAIAETSINISKEKTKQIKRPNINKEQDYQKVKTKKLKEKGSELVEYKPKTKFTFGKFLSYIIVIIISFISFIIFLDTFKFQLYILYPDLEIFLFSFYETLKDIQLFIIDLI